MSGPALDLQFSMMLFDHLTRNRQSDAKPAEELIVASIEVIEMVEDSRADFRSHADAVIFDGDHQIIIARVKMNLDVTAARAEFDGVINQGGQCAFERPGIACHARDIPISFDL